MECGNNSFTENTTTAHSHGRILFIYCMANRRQMNGKINGKWKIALMGGTEKQTKQKDIEKNPTILNWADASLHLPLLKSSMSSLSLELASSL